MAKSSDWVARAYNRSLIPGNYFLFAAKRNTYYSLVIVPYRQSLALRLNGPQHSLRGERNLPHARTGGVKYGVGNGRRDGNDGRLAAAQRLHFRPVDEHDLHVGNLLKTDHRITIPIQVFLPAGVELNLFEQSTAHSLQNIPLDLVFQAVGIDDQAAIVRQRNFLYGYVAGALVHFDFRDGCSHGIGAVGDGYASSYSNVATGCGSGRRAIAPTGLFGGGHENFRDTFVAGEIT